MANNIDDLPAPTKSGIDDLPAPDQASDAQKADLARYDAIGSKLAPTMGSFVTGMAQGGSLGALKAFNPSGLPEDPAAGLAGGVMGAGIVASPVARGVGSLISRAPQALVKAIPGAKELSKGYLMYKGLEGLFKGGKE